MEADEDEQTAQLIGLYGAMANKPDPDLLPYLVRLHELAAEDDSMQFYTKPMAQLIEELGGQIQAHQAEPSVGGVTGEWMDEEEDDEEAP